MTKKIRPAKKCEECGKIIREHNQSGLCSYHLSIKFNQEQRKKRKETGLCIQCGKKVEPIIFYPAGDTISPIIKNPVRCYDCRQREKGYKQKQQQICEKK